MKNKRLNKYKAANKNKGLLWHIKNGESQELKTNGSITVEDIRDLKKQFNEMTISKKEPYVFKKGDRWFSLYGGLYL